MSNANLNSASDLNRLNLPSSLVRGLDLTRRDRQSVSRGRSIITGGGVSSFAYVIVDGWAVSKLSIGTGETQIIDLLGPGSVIGLSQTDESSLRGYSAIALQDVSLYPLNLKALKILAGQDEQVSRWVMDTLSHKLRRMQTHVAALGQLPARGRLAFALLRILDVAQQLGQPMVGKPIRLPMTQEEIGNMLGLTNVSISKLMSAFRREDLIDYGRSRIVVKDVEALSRICGVTSEGVPSIRSNDNVGQVSLSSASRLVR